MIVFVFQMGGVGSSTIVSSLIAAGFSRQYLYHGRNWSGDFNNKDSVVHLHAFDVMKRVVDQCRRTGSLDQVVIITLVRELLSRNVSCFFKNFTNPTNQDWYFDKEERILNSSIRELIDAFRERNLKNMERAGQWPKKELSKALSFPVFKRPFDVDNGYSIYRGENLPRLFIGQTEKLNNSWGKLSEFIDRPSMEMVPSNVGEEKWYGQLYASFKREYRPTNHEIAVCNRTLLMQHYYSREDIEFFQRMWNSA